MGGKTGVAPVRTASERDPRSASRSRCSLGDEGTTVGHCPNMQRRRAGRLVFLPTTALATDRPNDVSGANAGVLLQHFAFAGSSPRIVESQTGGRCTHAEVPIYLRSAQVRVRTTQDPCPEGTNGWSRTFHVWSLCLQLDNPRPADRRLGQSNAQKLLFDSPGLSAFWRNGNSTNQ